MHKQHTEQMEAMKEVVKEREKSSTHLHLIKKRGYSKFFEAIMGIQKVKETEWVLHLSQLLNGKAKTVCTNIRPTTGYDGVKKAILEHYNINSERC